MEAGFYSNREECLPLDPTAQVLFPPQAVEIFLHPMIFGGQYVGSPVWVSGIKMEMSGNHSVVRVVSGTNQFKAGKYVVGIGI